MKNYNEIANRVLLRRDEYDETQKIKKKNITHISSLISCFVVVAIFGIGIWQGDWFDFNSLPIVNPSSQEGNNDETTNNTTQDQSTNQSTIPPTEQILTVQNTDPPDSGIVDLGGEVADGWFIPALPSDRDINITGEAITDAEAQEYFSKNQDSIIGSLSSSGVSSDSIKISEKGYCHVNYDGEEGKSFELRQNYRDYLVYNENELVAIITLWKEGGEISNTPSFGARWFDDYNAYLQTHKGEKLVYAYAGWFEIIIAPDNTYFNPMGHDVSQYLDGVEKPYEMFYHEAATYIP